MREEFNCIQRDIKCNCKKSTVAMPGNIENTEFSIAMLWI